VARGDRPPEEGNARLIVSHPAQQQSHGKKQQEKEDSEEERVNGQITPSAQKKKKKKKKKGKKKGKKREKKNRKKKEKKTEARWRKRIGRASRKGIGQTLGPIMNIRQERRMSERRPLDDGSWKTEKCLVAGVLAQKKQ
jgi:hypothetical protein